MRPGRIEMKTRDTRRALHSRRRLAALPALHARRGPAVPPALTTLLAVFVLVAAGCTGSDGDPLEEARVRYDAEPTVEHAVALAEAYNHHHIDRIEDARDGLAAIEGLIAAHPDDHHLRVLKGNLLTILAGHYADDEDFIAALETIAEGFQLIDRTVAEHPDDPYVRIYRAINGASVPEMFDRRKVAAADFEILHALGENETGREIQILTLYHFSRLARDLGEEERADLLESELNDRYPHYEREAEL
jgi:hypothetical protein